MKHFALQHWGAEDQDLAPWWSLLKFANIPVLQISALHRAADFHSWTCQGVVYVVDNCIQWVSWLPWPWFCLLRSVATPIRTRWISFLWDWFSLSCSTPSAHRWRGSRYVWCCLQFEHLFKAAICLVKHWQEVPVLFSLEKSLAAKSTTSLSALYRPSESLKINCSLPNVCSWIEALISLQSSSVVKPSKRNYWTTISKNSSNKYSLDFKPTSLVFIQELEPCCAFWLFLPSFASAVLFHPEHLMKNGCSFSYSES